MQVVVVEHGKRYNQRTRGDLDSEHSVPDRCRELSDPIEPDPPMTFSFKQDATDRRCWNTLAPNFGVGRHGHRAELQLAREDRVALDTRAFVRLPWDGHADPRESAQQGAVLGRGAVPGSFITEFFADSGLAAERAAVTASLARLGR